MTTFTRPVAYALLLAALFSTAARAQTYHATIRGIVADGSGQRMAGVEIRLMDERTQEMRKVTTDHAGRFTVVEVPPGLYRVTIDHAGYGRFVARTELAMNQEYWLNVELQPGDMIQAIDSIAPFLPSDHDTPAIHALVTDRDLNEWPVESGSFLELALIAPQSAPAVQGSPTAAHRRFAMNANGARDDSNNYILDGLENVDPSWNTLVARPPSDAIRQFQVFTSNYDASFGRAAGAQISAVTKSGANAFTGSLYGFGRGTMLGGRNHFAPKEGPAPEYTRSQAGATVGGPLLKNRTFFFLDYERTHLREGMTRVTNVPTAAERDGDFSQSLFSRPIDYLTGQPFRDGVIPGTRLNPFGRALAAIYPLPNRSSPFANYVSSPVMRDDLNVGDARLDQALGNGARLTGRYSVADRKMFEPFTEIAGPLVPGFGRSVRQRGHHGAITVTHVPSAAFVNDFRIGYSRDSQTEAGEDRSGIAPVVLTGYSPLGGLETDGERVTDAVELSDTVSSSHGHHTIRLGASWYGARQRSSPAAALPIVLTASAGTLTGNPLADLLLGFQFGQLLAPVRFVEKLETNGGALFLQNDWRPAPTFSVFAGVRYEYATPPVDPDNSLYLYDPAAKMLRQVGTNGMPRGGYVADAGNLAPRAGFAWTVGADRMNVIRGGYGVYYTQPPLSASGLFFLSPPTEVLAAAAAPMGLVFFPPSVVGYQRDLQTPRLDTWTLNFQHQLGQSRSFEFAYVGSRGRNLLAAQDINQPNAAAVRPNPRPNPSFADINVLESRASSRYNGFHIRFQQRPATGTSMFVQYTLGRATDDASGFLPTPGDPGFPQNSLDLQSERSRSSFDVRHRFSGAITRPLPFNKGQFLGKLGFISRALADSDVVAVATFQSGRPFTVLLLPWVDNSNTGSSRFVGANDRPNISGSAALARGTESAWFNTGVFSMPPFGSFGNSGRNSLTGPGYKSINAAIVKHLRFGIRDRAAIDLRLEAFNLLSTVNYHLPDAYFGSPTFGRILSAGSPRRVQFGVKAMF